MAIELYWGSGSPFAWRVMLTLEVKGLAYESKLLEFSKGEHKAPAPVGANISERRQMGRAHRSAAELPAHLPAALETIGLFQSPDFPSCRCFSPDRNNVRIIGSGRERRVAATLH